MCLRLDFIYGRIEGGGERTMFGYTLVFVTRFYIWTSLIDWLCTCVSEAEFYIWAPLVSYVNNEVRDG